MKLRNKKTGDIGELSVWYRADNREIEEFGVIKENEKFPTDYKSLAELNEEWEDYEELKKYWYLTDAGCLCQTSIHNDRTAIRKRIGNYFETKEEAEKAVEKLRAWKRLKDKGLEITGYGQYVHDGKPTHHINIAFYVINDEDRKDLDLLFGGEE